MSRHYRDQLAEFHAAFDVAPMAGLPHAERLALVALRATLIAEETRELAEAVSLVQELPLDEHRAALAKELVDLLYVTAGTAQLLGLPLADPASPPLTGRVRNGGFLIGAAVEQRSRDAQQDLDHLLWAMYRRSSPGDIAGAYEDLAPTLQSLADVLAAFAAAQQIPLRAVFDAVHASNMSKINPETGRPEFREDGKVLKGAGYVEPDVEAVLRQAA